MKIGALVNENCPEYLFSSPFYTPPLQQKTSFCILSCTKPTSLPLIHSCITKSPVPFSLLLFSLTIHIPLPSNVLLDTTLPYLPFQPLPSRSGYFIWFYIPVTLLCIMDTYYIPKPKASLLGPSNPLFNVIYATPYSNCIPYIIYL